MTFKMKLVCMFFPGGALIVIGGALLDHLHSLGVTLAMVGILLFIAWPIFTITVHIRHRLKLKGHKDRFGSEPVSIRDPLHTFVTGVEGLVIVFGLPVAFLGGIGVFCLVTADVDLHQKVVKKFVGVGCLVLLGTYLLLLWRGRSALTLRIAGVGVAVFGLAGAFALALTVGQVGAWGRYDGVMAIASVVMVAAGLWLAITGRNTFRRAETPSDGS